MIHPVWPERPMTWIKAELDTAEFGLHPPELFMDRPWRKPPKLSPFILRAALNVIAINHMKPKYLPAGATEGIVEGWLKSGLMSIAYLRREGIADTVKRYNPSTMSWVSSQMDMPWLPLQEGVQEIPWPDIQNRLSWQFLMWFGSGSTLKPSLVSRVEPIRPVEESQSSRLHFQPRSFAHYRRRRLERREIGKLRASPHSSAQHHNRPRQRPNDWAPLFPHLWTKPRDTETLPLGSGINGHSTLSWEPKSLGLFLWSPRLMFEPVEMIKHLRLYFGF